MNFYISQKSLPMPQDCTDEVERLIHCVTGQYKGLRPKYATPCVRRHEPLRTLIDCDTERLREFDFTGWVMVEVWSYNPDWLRRLRRILRSPRFGCVAAGIPQREGRSMVLLVRPLIVEGDCHFVRSHREYVEAHRLIRRHLGAMLPDGLHLCPAPANETDFLTLRLDTACFHRPSPELFFATLPNDDFFDFLSHDQQD